MSWLEIRNLLKERQMPDIPADLVASIEANTIHRRAWWQSDAFRLRWVPALVGAATVFGALWLSRIQKHPGPRAVLPMASRPEQAEVTLHAFLPSNEVTHTEKGDSRENPKS